MRNDRRLKIVEKLGEAIAGSICEVFGFFLHLLARLAGEVGAVVSGRPGASWGLLFGCYILAGALLGMLLGDRFFRYIEEKWFERD